MYSDLREIKPHPTGLWWTVLISASVLSLTFNIWHAIIWKHPASEDATRAQIIAELGKGGSVVLAVFIGVVPVAFAMMLSKGFTSDLASGKTRAVIVGLFVVGMIMSFTAQYQLMSLVFGDGPLAAGIPVILDVSDCVSLYLIARAHTLNKAMAEMADTEADRERMRADIEADIRPVIEADIRRTFEEDMSVWKADIETDTERTLAEQRADIERTSRADMERTLAEKEADMSRTLEAERADMSRTLETERADMEAGVEERVSALLAEREEALRRELEIELAARIRREQAPKTAARSGGKSKASTEVAAVSTAGSMPQSSKDALLTLLRREPGLTVKEQAASLNVSEKTIQRWRKRLEEEGSLPGATASAPLLRAVAGGQ